MHRSLYACNSHILSIHALESDVFFRCFLPWCTILYACSFGTQTLLHTFWSCTSVTRQVTTSHWSQIFLSRMFVWILVVDSVWTHSTCLWQFSYCQPFCSQWALLHACNTRLSWSYNVSKSKSAGFIWTYQRSFLPIGSPQRVSVFLSRYFHPSSQIQSLYFKAQDAKLISQSLTDFQV